MAPRSSTRNRRGAPPAKSQPAPPTTRAASKLKSRNWDVPVTGDDDNDEDNLAVSEPIGQTPEWYTKALDYWKNVPATVNGMLGGYEVLSPTDAIGSLKFLEEFVTGPSPRLQRNRVLDCGAGIGRVSRDVLLKVFERGDLVEVNPAFVEEAKRQLAGGRLERFICCGLQDFVPEEGRYDCIWTQWVLGHLNDGHIVRARGQSVDALADFVRFFQRCAKGLKPGGLIFVKENICQHGVVIDEDDSSMTRSLSIIKALFARADLTIIKEEKQKDFPPEIFAVYMFALEPKAPSA